MNKGVLLDVDGTLVAEITQDGQPPRGPRSFSEVRYLRGVEDGCKLLRDAGLQLITVSNQPDIARGLVPYHKINDTHLSIATNLRCNGWFICPHDDRDHCGCRKPLPGLCFVAAYKHDLDMRRSYMIGNSDRDRNAAYAAAIAFLDCREYSFQESVEWILSH